MSTVLSRHVFLKLSSLGRTFDCSVFIPIVHIAVIDQSESTDCHLLAVTHAGTDQQVGKERYHDFAPVRSRVTSAAASSVCRRASVLHHHAFRPSAAEAHGRSAQSALSDPRPTAAGVLCVLHPAEACEGP